MCFEKYKPLPYFYYVAALKAITLERDFLVPDGHLGTHPGPAAGMAGPAFIKGGGVSS